MSAPVNATEDPMFVVESPYEIANWRPLVNWVLYIPHAIVQYGLRVLAGVVFVIHWFVVLFTGKINDGLYGILVMYERYRQRADSFLIGYSEQYAPFDFNAGPTDNGAYPPITVTLPEAPSETPRTAVLNFILAIPHFLVFIVFGIGAAIVGIIAWFAVLFTGTWPKNMRDFQVRVTNYYLRIWAYVAMVDTTYPRFGLDPQT